jgi:hypothetical protein
VGEIHLHVTKERLDELLLDEVIALEEPQAASARQLRDAVARLMVNGDGAYLPAAEARRALGHVTQARFVEIAHDLFRQVRGLAVNPTKPGE